MKVPCSYANAVAISAQKTLIPKSRFLSAIEAGSAEAAIETLTSTGFGKNVEIGVAGEYDKLVAAETLALKKFVSDSYIGKEVYMGIRPENIHDDAAFMSNSPDSVIDVDVEVVELMGSETYLYLKTTGKDGNIVARVDPRSVSRTGDKIKVAFDVNRLHFFDKDTEATILTR